MAWNDPRKALANCKSAGFPSMTGAAGLRLPLWIEPPPTPAGKGQQMAKNQHADARGTQKIVRQNQKRLAKEQKLAKRRETREQRPKAEPGGPERGKGPPARGRQ